MKLPTAHYGTNLLFLTLISLRVVMLSMLTLDPPEVEEEGRVTYGRRPTSCARISLRNIVTGNTHDADRRRDSVRAEEPAGELLRQLQGESSFTCFCFTRIRNRVRQCNVTSINHRSNDFHIFRSSGNYTSIIRVNGK